MKFERITLLPILEEDVAYIRGHQLQVARVVDLVASGLTEEQIIAKYPGLTSEDIREALRFAAAASRHKDAVKTLLMPKRKPSELLAEHREEILQIATKRGASNIRVFGSVARGEDDENSDVDLLIDLERGRSLLDLSGLIIDIEDVLGIKVDVGTEKSLKPHLRDQVLAEAKPL